MRRKTLTLVLLLSCITDAVAGGLPSSFVEKLSSSCVSCSYSARVSKDGIPIVVDGTLLLQYNGYFVTGGGLEVTSDLVTVWTVDRESGEVYIEDADTSGELGLAANPALLLGNLSGAFRQKPDAKGCVLVPSIEDTGIEELSIVFSSPDIPSRMEVLCDDGSRTVVTITAFKYTDPINRAFVVDTGSLPSGYVVTDLR